MSSNISSDFDPEEACRQVSEYQRKMVRQFVVPCFLPTVIVCAAVAFVRPQFQSDRLFLVFTPVLAIYVASVILIVRRHRAARVASIENMRLLRRNCPHLMRKAVRPLLVMGSIACTGGGALGLLAASFAVIMLVREPPKNDIDYLYVPMFALFAAGLMMQVVSFWKSRAWLFPAVCFIFYGVLPTALMAIIVTNR